MSLYGTKEAIYEQMLKDITTLLEQNQPSNQSILNQLDIWIEQQAEMFKSHKMEIAEISSHALGQAYWNVKQLIQVNSGDNLFSRLS